MDVLECSICHAHYDENDHRPRNSPCGHEYCTNCLKELIKNGEYFCPKCRKKIQAHNVDDLPVNHGLIDVIRAFKANTIILGKEANLQGPKNPNKFCKIHCRTITHWCSGCKLWLCSYCLDSHTSLIGCKTATAIEAVEDMKKEYNGTIAQLMSGLEKDVMYVRSKFQEHTAKRDELENAKKHDEEVKKYQNILSEGSIHKDILLESKQNLNRAGTPEDIDDRIKEIIQQKNTLLNWTARNIIKDGSFDSKQHLLKHDGSMDGRQLNAGGSGMSHSLVGASSFDGSGVGRVDFSPMSVLTSQQKMVYQVVMRAAGHNGAYRDGIYRALLGVVNRGAVDEHLEFLTREGYIYSTVSDDHFRPTDESCSFAEDVDISFVDERHLTSSIELTGQQKLVYQVILQTAVGHGIYRGTIYRALEGKVNRGAVDEVLEFLCSEGYIYSTVDDDHFRTTDESCSFADDVDISFVDERRLTSSNELTGQQKLVYQVIMQTAVGHGISRGTIYRALEGKVNRGAVDEVLEFLSSEGHIYSTVDDDHFRTTDESCSFAEDVDTSFVDERHLTSSYELTGQQKLVYQVIMQTAVEHGTSRGTIYRALEGKVERGAVDEVLEFLSSEGHIYSTVDDDHFRTTDESCSFAEDVDISFVDMRHLTSSYELTGQQKLVYQVIMQTAVEHGIYRGKIYRALEGKVDRGAVDEVLEFLSSEGHIHSTVDDDHFRTTD